MPPRDPRSVSFLWRSGRSVATWPSRRPTGRQRPHLLGRMPPPSRLGLWARDPHSRLPAGRPSGVSPCGSRLPLPASEDPRSQGALCQRVRASLRLRGSPASDSLLLGPLLFWGPISPTEIREATPTAKTRHRVSPGGHTSRGCSPAPQPSLPGETGLP